MYEDIRDALGAAVTETNSPGAVLYVGDRDNVYLHEAFGLRIRVGERRSARKDTLYDLASLTKVVATTTAVMQLRDAGLIRLDQPITDFVPIPNYDAITLFHLLTHTAGLTPDNPYYPTVTSMDELLFRYAEKGIVAEPGVEQQYNDLGFMLLGRMVEVVTRDSLDNVCRKNIFEPLGMTRTAFNPPKAWAANCAASEKCRWRGRVIIGEVHDENAYAVGGVAGHAGLFSIAEDLARFCRGLLDGSILREETLIEMTTLAKFPPYPWQGLGWEMDPWSSKKKGYLPGRSVFGHTGWSGTSMWIDRDSGRFVILLGNTSHPSRKKMDNENFRRIVHLAVAKRFYPMTTAGHGGLDRLVRENFAAVSSNGARNGKTRSPRRTRIGLLTNHASVDELGRHITEVMSLTELAQLDVLFSPEHGISGRVERGLKAGDEEHVTRVVSLYRSGDETLREGLEGIELFVVDLQDVGARYYTYNHTMRRCIRACIELGTPVLVLDRPNPVGGLVLEGPIARDTSTPVSCAAIPVRHGMTMGELAMHYVSTEHADSNSGLKVNYLDNWPRARLFSECSLPWIPPSPNIPSPETALLYVGNCLFEGTNLNEGRGTETPFHLIGAPWLDAQAVIDALHEEDTAGLRLTSEAYVPRSIPGKASSPRYQDQECAGIRIDVLDPHTARPFRLAVALIQAVRARHAESFSWQDESTFDALAGGPDLRSRLEAGQTTASIVDSYREELEAFDAFRPKLYDADGIPPLEHA